MCGIAGSIGAVAPSANRVGATLQLMRKRGPDAHGSHQAYLGEHHVTLLHTRLAIIDLDPRADQPFVADDCALVFNGEIYNYLELRQELEQLGHRFQTDSDTEVITKAYRQFGDACLDRFEGMWAFALLDQREQSLLLSRDRFGEKPLYYALWDGTFYFASEIKFLAALAGRSPQISAEQLRRFLVNGYKALYKQPATFFSDVHEFPPASVARLTGPDQPSASRYWSLTYRPRQKSMAEAIEGARERLIRAVELRLRSDVPVAFCLSGGVDSTGLASIAVKHFGQQIHAFSIVDDDERYDERENLAVTVEQLGCRHHVTQTSTDHFFERLSELVAYHDSPISTISYYVHAFLSEAIAEKGFKVAISGTGADELFTGYYDHYAFWLAEMHGRADFPTLLNEWNEGYGRFIQNPLLQDPLVFHKNPAQREHIFLNHELFSSFLVEPLDEDFTETAYSNSGLRNRMMNELFHESVPVMLHEDDLNSMRWSVENRSPYLDRELAEFLYTVPSEHLIHDGYVKWLLRAAVEEFAPAQVMQDKRKRGFNASIDSLVDRSDPDTRDRLLAPSPIFDLVRRDAIEDFIADDMTDNSYSKFLFSFISAKLFLESDLVAGTWNRRYAA